MRDFKGMKRQRGRNRGGGGGQPKHNANRAFDSNGPEGIKVRGAAQGVFEKYQQLARDAASAGDRVLAENYLQHAEHYFRVVRAMQPQRPASEILGKEGFSTGFDIDFEAEPEEATVETPAEGGEAQGDGEGGEGQPREPRNFDNNNRREDRGERQQRFENRDRDNRDRGDRNFERNNGEGGQREGRRERWRDRDDRPRDDRPREDRPRDDRQRDDRPREDRAREEGGEPRAERGERNFDRPRRERNFERQDREPREQRDPLAVVEPQATPLASSRDDDVGSPRLRGQDGAVSEAPAFLSRGAAPAAAPAASADDAEPAPKPRRGRPKKAAVSEAE